MEKHIERGVIHLHTEFSRYDSASHVGNIIQRMYELNAPAFTITDHGNMIAMEKTASTLKEFNETHNTNIKLVPGCEVYYQNDDDLTGRKHLILLAKDKIGYKAVSKIVTRGNERIDSGGFPRINDEILESIVGPDGFGHGHVIATSACMAGIIATVLLQNKYVEKDIEKCKKKQKKLYSPTSPFYIKNKKEVEAMTEEIKSLQDEIKELKKVAEQKFKQREKRLETLKKKGDTEAYADAEKAINTDKAKAEQAQKEIEASKEKLRKLKLDQKNKNTQLKTEEKDHDKWNAIEQKIEDYKKHLVEDKELVELAKSETMRFKNLFGEGNFYLELQNHRIEEEVMVMPIIADIAKELNVPVVAANDAHMVYNTDNEIKSRQIMRSLRYNKWDEISESDKELYIKDDDELFSILCEIIPSEIATEAMNNIKVILDQCDVPFEKENHYPKFVSPVPGETSKGYIIRLANEGIEWRYPNREGWTDEHQKRMEYELDVIDKLGVNDYLAIVEDFLRYGRLIGKLDMKNPDPRYLANPYDMDLLEEITKDEVGLGIGPGRGSAVGSLVCYLIGITGLDPMKYNLFFERFLNTERVTMPKIIYWASNVNPIAQGCIA